MAWSITVEPAKHLVVCSLSGKVNFKDVAAARDSIRQQPSFDPAFDHLIDFSGITTLAVNAEEMRRLAEQPDPFSERATRIIVAPTDGLYGMARMYDSIGERQHPNEFVVRSMEEALAILGARGEGAPPEPEWRSS